MLSCQRPSPSQLGPNSRAVVNSAPGTGLTGEVAPISSPQTILLRLFPSRRCLPVQSDGDAKGRGAGDVSLTRIYRDTWAGLGSLQRWEHDDSKEGMCPGEKAGPQTDGGSPQVQNLATLSKKDVTTRGKAFSPPSPRHCSHSWHTRCYCFPALDLLFLRVLLSGIRRQENVASILTVPPQITPCFLKTSLPKYDPPQQPHQVLIFLFPFFPATKYRSSETLVGFGSFIKDVKFDAIRDVKFDDNSGGLFQSKRFLAGTIRERRNRKTQVFL